LFEATQRLIQKMLRAEDLKAGQRSTLRKALDVLADFPASEDNILSIELVGPARWVGHREIFRWWNVHFEDDALHVSSGGHLFETGKGCDTFITFTWDWIPEVVSIGETYADPLNAGSNSISFEAQVELMELSEPGYRISVIDARQPLLNGANSRMHSAVAMADAGTAAGCEFCGRPVFTTPEPARRAMACR
jgi:hypothetical protein